MLLVAAICASASGCEDEPVGGDELVTIQVEENGSPCSGDTPMRVTVVNASKRMLLSVPFAVKVTQGDNWAESKHTWGKPVAAGVERADCFPLPPIHWARGDDVSFVGSRNGKVLFDE